MSGARTLCIPTIFVSYTGESLDYKAPLLKALHLVDKAATEVCQFFDKNVTKVIPTLGVEQEYFLVDKALFEARPDLILTGRTLFGAEPAKGQQLEDHYFGSIPERVYAFMVDFEVEALKLGIPLKTRHNEVAPGQFECAPIFEEVNIAVDHNALLMDVMDRIAKKHNFRVLFHEKPFSKVNGSGKHNNWSLSTNTGKNLLSPGKAPKDNLQFLTFFVNVIKAVHDHADLLRATIATAGNDHRLGANEAPPAIMSIFIGEQLTHVLDEIEKPSSGKKEKETGGNAFMKLGINKIPEILLDNTDRNRTSPFAFTGNKFEFRAVGSSANSSAPMIALNTIVANQLMEFRKEVETRIESGEKKDLVILDILKGYIKKSKKILFEGNGYGDAWVKEAEKRGLSNVKTTPHALGAYISKPSIKVFEENGIFTERELEARYEIKLETYIKKVQIESRVLGDLALNHIIPTAITYQNELIENVKGLKELDLDKAYYEVQIDNIRKISDYLVSIRRNVYEMIEERKKANVIEEGKEKAIAYCEKVFPYFDKIRYASDKLEAIVDDQRWPLPKYRELLFLR
jgi:glutamine synthetase